MNVRARHAYSNLLVVYASALLLTTAVSGCAVDLNSAPSKKKSAAESSADADTGSEPDGSTPAPTPPAAPAGITTGTVSSSSIQVSWTDAASDETAYEVQKCSGASCASFAAVSASPLAAGAGSHTENSLSASTVYRFRVRAVNAAGSSVWLTSGDISTLSGGGAFSNTWSFSPSTAYTFDPASIEITAGGVCRLVSLDQTDSDNSSTGFGGGTHSSTQWDAGNLWLEPNGTHTQQELPGGSTSTGWANMTGNVMLLRMNGTVGAVGNGASVTDSSASARTCTTVNSDSAGLAYQSGKLGQAFSFDGTDYVTCGASGIPSGGAARTAMAWIQLSGFGGTILATNTSSGQLWSFAMVYTDAWYLFSDGVNPGNNISLAVTDIPSYQTGTWAHVALTQDASNGWKYYLNGELKGSGAFGTAINTGTPTSVTVGSRLDVPSQNFPGPLDEVAFFNRELSGAEIAAIAARQKPAHSSSFDSRVLDAGASLPWNSLAWVPQRPTLKQLPDSKATESAYAAGNANMSNNVLLLHMNGTEGAISHGASITDASGSGNTGTASNGNTGMAYAKGRYREGIFFDGADDFITTGTTGVPSGATARTVEAWIKPSGDGGNILSITTATGQAWHVGMSNLGAWYLYSDGINSDDNIVVTGSDIPPLDEWSHFAFVTESSTSWKYYLNGVLAESGTFPTAMNTGAPSSVVIGNRPDLGGATHFDGLMDEVALYSRALTGTEILDRYKRGVASLKYQVRTCPSAACTGISYIGPDGTASTYFSELTTPALGLPSLTIAPANNRYFQYRAYLESDHATYVPELKSVTIGPSRYSAGSPTVVNNTPASYQTLSAFTQTLGGSNAGTVTYQISPNGTNWYYHNGTGWAAASGAAQSSSAAAINTNASSIAGSAIGTGSFYFKAFLNSDGSQQVELDEVAIQGTQ